MKKMHQKSMILCVQSVIFRKNPYRSFSQQTWSHLIYIRQNRILFTVRFCLTFLTVLLTGCGWNRSLSMKCDGEILAPGWWCFGSSWGNAAIHGLSTGCIGSIQRVSRWQSNSLILNTSPNLMSRCNILASVSRSMSNMSRRLPCGQGKREKVLSIYRHGRIQPFPLSWSVRRTYLCERRIRQVYNNWNNCIYLSQYC